MSARLLTVLDNHKLKHSLYVEQNKNKELRTKNKAVEMLKKIQDDLFNSSFAIPKSMIITRIIDAVIKDYTI